MLSVARPGLASLAFLAVAVTVGLAATRGARAQDAAPAPDAAQPQSTSTPNKQVEEAAKDKAHPEQGQKTKEETAASSATKASPLECRSKKVTGTKIPKRVCATPEQWAALDAKGEAAAKDMLRRGQEQSVVAQPQAPGVP